MKARKLLIPLALVLASAMAILLSVALTAPVRALGTTYYVNAVTGDDSRTPAEAQNPATPWKTIAHAAATVPAGGPGDPNVIQVAPGIYDGSGNGEVFPILFANADVRLAGDGAGYTIIDGEGVTDIISITVPGIAVEGFTIQNAADDAIEASAGGFSVADNVFQGVGYGIDLSINQTVAGGAYAVPPVLVQGNDFTVVYEAVYVDIHVDGSGMDSHVTVGDIDILANTFVFSGTAVWQYLVNIYDIGIEHVDGGTVDVGAVTIADNAFTGAYDGVDFFGEINAITDTVATVGDVSITGNLFQGQEHLGMDVDYYDAEHWYGNSTGTFGDLVIRDNGVDAHGGFGYGIEVSDLGYWNHFYDAAALTVGNLIIEDNDIHSRDDAVYVHYTEINALYGSAAVTVGDALLAGNTITTVETYGDGISVEYITAGHSVYSDTIVSLGSLTIAENTINAMGEGIFVYPYEVGSSVFGNAAVSMGDIAVVSNTITGTYGIDLQYYNSGKYVYGAASVTLGNATIAGNEVNATGAGLYYYLYDVGYGMDDQATAQMGELNVSDNIISAGSGWCAYIYYEYVGYDLVGDSALMIGDTTFQDNDFSCGYQGVEVYYYDYNVGSHNEDNATVELPSYTFTGNNFDQGYQGIYFYTYSNPNDTYGSAMIDFGDFLVDGNTFTGGDGEAIHLYYEDVCEDCYDGSGAVIGDIVISNNLIGDMVSHGIYLYFDELGYAFDYTGTVEMGDVVVSGNVLEDIGGSGIYVDYSELSSEASAAVTVGSLYVVQNEIRSAASDGIYVGYYLEASGDGTTTVGQPWVRGNTIRDCGGSGIYFYTDVYTFANGMASMGDPVIAANRVVNCTVGVNLDLETKCLIVNNMLSSRGATGIFVQYAPDLRIVHNTIANPTEETEAGIAVLNGVVSVTNTIIATYTQGIENMSGTVSEDYNLFAVTVADIVGPVSSGGHSISGGNPAFVDPWSADYHITAASDALDAGAVSGVPRDFDRDPRPVGGGYDIGADEHALRLYLPLIMRLAP